jgi:hypothetical protein
LHRVRGSKPALLVEAKWRWPASEEAPGSRRKGNDDGCRTRARACPAVSAARVFRPSSLSSSGARAAPLLPFVGSRVVSWQRFDKPASSAMVRPPRVAPGSRRWSVDQLPCSHHTRALPFLGCSVVRLDSHPPGRGVPEPYSAG